MILIGDGRDGPGERRDRGGHLTVGNGAVPEDQPILSNVQLRAVLGHTADAHPARRGGLDDDRRGHVGDAKDHVQPGGR